MKQPKKRPVGRPKKSDKKIPVSVRLSPEVAKYIRCLDKPAVVLQSLIETSDGYKQWKGK